jgi:hypothetical protein
MLGYYRYCDECHGTWIRTKAPKHEVWCSHKEESEREHKIAEDSRNAWLNSREYLMCKGYGKV